MFVGDSTRAPTFPPPPPFLFSPLRSLPRTTTRALFLFQGSRSKTLLLFFFFLIHFLVELFSNLVCFLFFIFPCVVFFVVLQVWEVKIELLHTENRRINKRFKPFIKNYVFFNQKCSIKKIESVQKQVLFV
jgi:hypothetical protein